MKKIGRKDIMLILLLLALAVISYLIVRLMQTDTGGQVIVTVDGKRYGSYDLAQEQSIDIVIAGETANILHISDETADMTDASCPDQLCVHQRAISKKNESIVCLPNKVVVTIEGTVSADMDSMAR